MTKKYAVKQAIINCECVARKKCNLLSIMEFGDGQVELCIRFSKSKNQKINQACVAVTKKKLIRELKSTL